MKPRPWLVVAPPVVERLVGRTYRAWSPAFPELVAVERSAEAALFVARLLIQKRLYGQAWTWGARALRTPAAQGVPAPENQ
jgi:hypothetical protein